MSESFSVRALIMGRYSTSRFRCDYVFRIAESDSRITKKEANDAEAPQKQQKGVNRKEKRRGDRNESLTVLRASEVLKTFRYVGEELSLSVVIERAQLPKTTTFRLLKTLSHGGLLERSSSGIYRSRFAPISSRSFRIGFAAQGDSEFCRTVVRGIEKAAAREHIDLITVNNRYSAREALRKCRAIDT